MGHVETIFELGTIIFCFNWTVSFSTFFVNSYYIFEDKGIEALL